MQRIWYTVLKPFIYHHDWMVHSHRRICVWWTAIDRGVWYTVSVWRRLWCTDDAGYGVYDAISLLSITSGPYAHIRLALLNMSFMLNINPIIPFPLSFSLFFILLSIFLISHFQGNLAHLLFSDSLSLHHSKRRGRYIISVCILEKSYGKGN